MVSGDAFVALSKFLELEANWFLSLSKRRGSHLQEGITVLSSYQYNLGGDSFICITFSLCHEQKKQQLLGQVIMWGNLQQSGST